MAEVASLGGHGRRDKLTPKQRQASARAAALIRWRRTPKAVRREAARKAVQARWAKAKATKARE